jgi:GNAT superfamily N-acetyltransferase
MQEWQAREAHDRDADQICALFERVFQKPLARAVWEWKLRTRPSPAPTEWVADAHGRIVGHYAVTPVRFRMKDGTVIVPHGCDAVTDADFRRRGILTALATRANEVWQTTGAPFQVGFHYGGWGSVREQVGWRPVARMTWFQRWLRPLSALRRKLGMRPFVPATVRSAGESRSFGSVGVERAVAADARFDDLWASIGLQYGTLAVRDREWIQWRCFDRPEADQRVLLGMRSGRPAGYCAFRLHREKARVWGTVIDLFVAPDDVEGGSALLEAAAQDMTAAGAESMHALAVTGSPLATLFRRNGLRARPQGFDFSVIRYAGSPVTPAAEWFLTGAEGDVV